ncbi:MAG: hypothetical protein ABI376_03700 [Caulobacteraceae bacterium]
MKGALTALCLAASLGGCAGLSGSGGRLAQGKALLAAEGLLDIAVIAADTAIRSGDVPPATAVAVRTLANRAAAVARAARTAWLAGDTAGAASRTASLALAIAGIQALASHGMEGRQ